MNEPRRHHIVPRMLLKRFASNVARTQIWAYDIDHDDIKEVGLKQTPVIKDFYSWVDETDDGQERDAWFEMWMGANPEATTGQLIDGIAACGELDKRELTQVAQFMLLQTIRTPLGQALLRHDLQTQFRRVHEPLRRRDFDAAYAQIAELYERLLHRPPQQDEAMEWMEILAAEATGVKRESEPTRNALITHIIRTLFPYGREPLVSMGSHCNLARYHRAEADLVISDTPATFADVARDDVISEWPNRPPESISMPISPEWMIELRPKALGVPDDWESHVGALNERTWRWADRFVFASRRELLEPIAATLRAQPPSPLPDHLAHRRRRQ